MSKSEDSFSTTGRKLPGGFKLFVAVVVIGVCAGGIWLLQRGGSQQSTAPAAPPPVMMVVSPPPPPPPPPPPQQTPQERPQDDVPQMQERVMQEMTPLEETPVNEPDAPAAEAMGTNVQGDGSPDSFGLSNRGGGGRIGGTGTGIGGGAGGGNRAWNRYARGIESRLTDELRRASQLRSANLRIAARVWIDRSGRITRVHLSGTGLTEEIKQQMSEQLTGLQLDASPPEDLPMPVVMRVQALRSN